MSEASKYVQKVKPVYIDATGQEITHPAEGLPFNTYAQQLNEANWNEGLKSNTITAANWGAGLEYYPYSFTVMLYDTTPFNQILERGYYLQLDYIQALVQYPYFYGRIMKPPIFDGTTYFIHKTFLFPKFRVQAGDSIVVDQVNRTGAQVQLSSNLKGIIARI